MSPILSLRHYNHDQIIHSHHHTQLVFGLRGRLDFEIEGQGSRIQQQFLAVVPSEALTVGEIAARVGYASQSAFTAALAREYGTTPRVIRREAHDKLRE